MPATFSSSRPCGKNNCSGTLELSGEPTQTEEGLRGTYYCNKCARKATFTRPSEKESLKNSSKSEVIETLPDSRILYLGNLRSQLEICVDNMTEILREMRGVDHLDPKNLDIGKTLNRIYGELQTHMVELHNLSERLK